jgi:hypothetical protein
VGEIILYQTEDGSNRIEVRLEGETVWLPQKAMAELFQQDGAEQDALGGSRSNGR